MIFPRILFSPATSISYVPPSLFSNGRKFLGDDFVKIVTVEDTLLGSWEKFRMGLTSSVFSNNRTLFHFLSFIRLINKLLSAAYQHSSVDASGHGRNGELHDVR